MSDLNQSVEAGVVPANPTQGESIETQAVPVPPTPQEPISPEQLAAAMPQSSPTAEKGFDAVMAEQGLTFKSPEAVKESVQNASKIASELGEARKEIERLTQQSVAPVPQATPVPAQTTPEVTEAAPEVAQPTMESKAMYILMAKQMNEVTALAAKDQASADEIVSTIVEVAMSKNIAPENISSVMQTTFGPTIQSAIAAKMAEATIAESSTQGHSQVAHIPNTQNQQPQQAPTEQRSNASIATEQRFDEVMKHLPHYQKPEGYVPDLSS